MNREKKDRTDRAKFVFGRLKLSAVNEAFCSTEFMGCRRVKKLFNRWGHQGFRDGDVVGAEQGGRQPLFFFCKLIGLVSLVPYSFFLFFFASRSQVFLFFLFFFFFSLYIKYNP